MNPALASWRTRTAGSYSPSRRGLYARVYFAGLTPRGVGLYQINCQVPESASTGDLTRVVARDEWPATAAKPPVAR